RGALVFPQAERDAVRPAFARRRLRGEQPQVGAWLDAHAAARGDRRYGFVGARERDRLVAVTHEFGDAAEGADTPLRFRIGDLGGQKVQTFYGSTHSSPPDISCKAPAAGRAGTLKRVVRQICLGSTPHHGP